MSKRKTRVWIPEEYEMRILENIEKITEKITVQNQEPMTKQNIKMLVCIKKRLNRKRYIR